MNDMGAAKKSEKYKRQQLTRLQREQVARDAVTASEHQKSLRAAFLARNPGALA